MDNKTIILGLVTLGALAFAGYLFITQQKAPADTTPASQVKSSELATASSSSTSSPEVSPTTSPSPGASARTFSDKQALSLPNTTETIEPGRGLLSLASAHEVSVTDLATLNGIKDVNKITAGQTIIVPDSSSGGSLVILYILNTEREKKEESKLKGGSTSIYSDPVTAAQTDTKGIADLSADTPYSKSNETDKAITLSSTVNNRIVTLSMEKTAGGLWSIKKLSSKQVSAVAP